MTNEEFERKMEPIIGQELVIDQASPGWSLLSQSGVWVDCQVGQSLDSLLRQDFALKPLELERIETLILDGSAVDNPSQVVVKDGSRLALAAGVPGVVGLAMKKNSALRALRSSITRRPQELPKATQPGRVQLALYGLALDALGAHFLAKGFWVTFKQLARYVKFGSLDLVRSQGQELLAKELLPELLKDPQKLVYFKAFLKGSIQEDSDLVVSRPIKAKSQDEPDEGCQNCPVACSRPQKSGWRRHQEELALLWGLDPHEEGIPELAGDFRRLANDLGLEAFELSGSVALVLKAQNFPPTQGSIRQLFQQLREETALGQLLGQGRAMVANYHGLDLQITPHLGEGLQKQSPHDAPTTALLDSLGVCERAAGALSGSDQALGALGEVLTAKYGRVFVMTELAALGQRIVSLESEYNQNETV
ncbi:MAG: hypothetical protein LBT86_10045 [Deltaproteobacteria bacterium]|nr:hypothetical protein [Deltaproteobacteria bacterium]